MVLFGNGGKNARLLGTALLIVTFVAGALAGAAVIRVVNAEGPRAEKQHERGRMRGGPRRLLLDEQFIKELGLSAQQQAQIKQILDRRDVAAKQMWESFEPRLKEFGKATHDEIQKVLTAEQQQKLDAALAQKRGASKRHNCPPNDSTKRAEEKA